MGRTTPDFCLCLKAQSIPEQKRLVRTGRVRRVAAGRNQVAQQLLIEIVIVEYLGVVFVDESSICC
jgi:hypothetical protein